jgi:lipopolysaccharide heptosyltransferase I
VNFSGWGEEKSKGFATMTVRQVPLPFPPRRIAIVKPSALGDVLNALPVLTALRRRFPTARLAWIVNRAYAPLLEPHPDLEDIIPFDRAALHKGWLAGSVAFARFLRHLHAQRFDLVLDLQGLLRSGLMTLATGAPVRIGLASAREGSRWCYTHRVDDLHGVRHAVDRCWRVAEALGATDAKQFDLPIEPSARQWAYDRLRSWPRPWMAVGAGARWLTKRWPPASFAMLLRRAQTQFGGTAIFIGAPDEVDVSRQVAEKIAGPHFDLTGQTTLAQLAAVLAEADVLLANDTGPLHLAVALGRPVVAPYTCTQVVRNGPYGQFEHAVETDVWCKGSYRKQCDRLECMAELTPERLWPRFCEVLATWQARRLPA